MPKPPRFKSSSGKKKKGKRKGPSSPGFKMPKNRGMIKTNKRNVA